LLSKNLLINNLIESKIMEFKNYLSIRSGIVFVGDTFTGKTSTIQMVKNIIHKKGIDKWNS